VTCPRCHNAGFVPTKDVNNPLIVQGKESFDKFNIRRVICVQCGYYFKTEEHFNEEIEIKGVKIMALVENYQNMIKAQKKISQAARINRSLFEEN